jgi:hypothetical protein
VLRATGVSRRDTELVVFGQKSSLCSTKVHTNFLSDAEADFAQKFGTYRNEADTQFLLSVG